jgi:hypothetical protein
MVKRPKMNIYVWIVLAVIIVPVAFVGGSYILKGATGHELYNEINTDLQLFDATYVGGVPAYEYTLLEYDTSRVFTTLMASVDVTHIEGLSGIKLYICKDINGAIGEAIVSVNMEKVGANTFKSTIDVDGWATDSYWAKISPVVSTHQISSTNPDYADWVSYMNWWNSLSETQQLSQYEIWQQTGGGLPRQPSQYIYETKSDVFVIVDGPQKFVVKNPNKDLIFTFGITLEDGTVYSGGAISQGMTFWVTVTTGVITQAALAIYERPVKLVTSFNDINTAEFNMGGAQENGNYYAKVILYGADGWNGCFKNLDFSIHNIEEIDEIAGTTTVFRATESGWVVVHNGGEIGGDLKVEVVLTSGNVSAMTAVFDGAGGDYRFPLTYDAVDDTWKVTLNTREMVNSYYTFYVEATRMEDGAVSFLSGSAFDTKGGAMEIPTIMVFVLMGAIVVVVIVVCLMTGATSKLKMRRR